MLFEHIPLANFKTGLCSIYFCHFGFVLQMATLCLGKLRWDLVELFSKRPYFVSLKVNR